LRFIAVEGRMFKVRNSIIIINMIIECLKEEERTGLKKIHDKELCNFLSSPDFFLSD
jgi:hypothetical protein